MNSHDRSKKRNRTDSSRRKRSFEAAAVEAGKERRSHTPMSLLRRQIKRNGGKAGADRETDRRRGRGRSSSREVRGGYYVLAKLNALNFSKIKVLNLLPH